MTWKALFRLSLFSIGALVPLAGCHREVSGTYLAADQSGVVSVALVRTPDDHLSGQLVVDQISPDGTISRKSTSITGAVDGENLSVTTAGLLGIGSTTLSGTLNGDTLTLTEPQAQALILKRSSLRNYQVQLSALGQRSQAMLKAKDDAEVVQRMEREERSFVDTVDHLVAHMQRIDSTSDILLGRFATVDKRYQDITAKINTYVERERRLSVNPNEAIDRASLYVDANQAAIDTNQLHLDMQSVQQDFEINAKPVADSATVYENECRDFETQHGNLTPAEIEAHSAACGRLLAALPLFRQRYVDLSLGLTHVEGIYIQENNTQQALLQTARKLQ
jgi:hypothetical protein